MTLSAPSGTSRINLSAMTTARRGSIENSTAWRRTSTTQLPLDPVCGDVSKRRRSRRRRWLTALAFGRLVLAGGAEAEAEAEAERGETEAERSPPLLPFLGRDTVAKA